MRTRKTSNPSNRESTLRGNPQDDLHKIWTGEAEGHRPVLPALQADQSARRLGDLEEEEKWELVAMEAVQTA